MNRRKRIRQCLVHTHRKGRAGRRQDRGLRAGRGRRQDGRRQQQHPKMPDKAVAEQFRADGLEYVGGVLLIAQPDTLGAHTGECHRGHAHQRIGGQQQERRDDCRTARCAPGVVRLLVAGHGGVPAPVDEDRCQHCGGDDGAEVHATGPEPGQRRQQRVALGVMCVDLDQGDHREGDQHHHLDGEQPVLQPRRYFDAPITDVGHDHDPDDARDRGPQHAVGQARGRRPAEVSDKSERVGTGDLGEVGQADHVGGDDAPAAQPSDDRPEGTGGPGEGGAAVRFGLVQLLIGHRDEIHRDERDQHDRGRLDPGEQGAAAGDNQSERRGETVGGRGGGKPDHHAGQQTQRSALESLALYRDI
ncbi:Uncharacterised protein [Mycobacteroides abscessus subsp. abscessus]|nr:Uncharacterised protein [Mycobacteroides abscessus subsp. abscessus]